jgi:hypothetical protein
MDRQPPPIKLASSVVWELNSGGFALAEVPPGWTEVDGLPNDWTYFATKDEAMSEQRRRYGSTNSQS